METAEQAVRQMWQQIQSLQGENRKLREALESMGGHEAVRGIFQITPMTAPPFEVERIVFGSRAAAVGSSWPVRRPSFAPAPAPAPSTPPSPVPSYLSAVPAYAPSADIAPGPVPAPEYPTYAPMGTANIDVGVVRQLTVEQLNQLPYGVVVVDREGTVLTYNDTESRLANVPRDRVLMRNFFREVAPCTQVKEFEGRFLAFTRGETRSPIEQFDFAFNFAAGTQYVTIIFTPGRARGTYNILMTRR